MRRRYSQDRNEARPRRGSVRKPGRKGSAVVLLCILFVTVTGALAVTYEAADRKAAVCVAEAAFDSAGRSVLACYDRELFDQYGVFAFEGDEEKTGQRLEKIAKASIEKTKTGGAKVKHVSTEQSAYGLSEPENLMIQLRKITARSAVVEALGGLKEDIRFTSEKTDEKQKESEIVTELEQEQEERKQQAAEAVERAGQAMENAEEEFASDAGAAAEAASAELEEMQKAENIQKDLRQRADSITGEPSGESSGGRTLRNGRVADSLPSVSAGCRGKSAFAGGTLLQDLSEGDGSHAISDDLVTVAYIDSYFHNRMEGEPGEKRFFRGETEYILYGEMSDEENYRKAYRSIFVIRTAVNSAYLYTDVEKRSVILAAAEAMTPGPFAPLTQVLLTTLWAAVEADNDMKNLENGNGVPLVKNTETWMTDLDGTLQGAAGESWLRIPGESAMKYQRYLDLLLLTLERDTKLYRIMDLIQINLKGTVREDFTIADHYTGFALRAEIGKRSHAVGVVNSAAEINMSHTYCAEN